MNEIVEYHNDLHKLSMGSFTELEQNLLFGVLVKCREQKSGVEIELKADDLMRFINQRKNTTKQDLLNIALNLYDNFFKLDFKIIKKQGNLERRSYYNLFSKFDIYINNIENLEKQKLEQEFSHLVLKVNDDFAYLLHEFTNGLYTQFELEEFLFLRGKYPKILYRLLKQFRLTGYFIATWEKFKEKMGIPLDMRNATIEKQILKPCVEKLSQTMKTHLFDARIPFENLKYKLKKESSKRGKPKVTHIEFYFKPQEPSCLDERQKYINEQKAKKPIVEPNEPRYITELKELCQKHKKYKVGDDIHELIKVVKNDNGDYELYYKRNNETLVTPLTYENAQKYLKATKG